MVPGEKVIPLKRNDWLGLRPTLIMKAPEPLLGVSSLMIVRSLVIGVAVPAPVIVVCPLSVIPLVIETPVNHVNVPAGIVMVSPSRAALCKACTLAADPLEL